MTQLLQNALYGSVMILIVAALRRLLRSRLAPEVWLVLWAVCLLRLLAPAAPESALSVYRLPALLEQTVPAAVGPLPGPVPGPAGGPATEPSNAAPDAEGPGNAPPPSASPSTAPVLTPGAVLTAVWLAGSAVTAVRLLLSWRKARRTVRRAPLLPRSDPRYAALPPGARLREGPVEGAPLTFGVLRPTVVLSPGLSGPALESVLAHEGVHARRRDNLWHYAAALAQLVFWWDPAVYLLARLLRRDIELSCDRAALRRLGPERRADYARAILSMSTRGEGVPFSRAFGQKQAEERILAIMNYKKMTVRAIAFAIALVCLVTAAFATDPVSPSAEPVSPPAEAKPSATPEAVSPSAEGDDPYVQQLTALLQDYLPRYLTQDNAVSPQADCPHTHWQWAPNYSYMDAGATQHKKITIFFKLCNDCNEFWTEPPASIEYEGHSFGPGTYVGSNHSAANPSDHYYIYSHSCQVCLATYSYTVPAPCTKDACVDVRSVGNDGEAAAAANPVSPSETETTGVPTETVPTSVEVDDSYLQQLMLLLQDRLQYYFAQSNSVSP